MTRILLLNFTESEAASVSKAGYSVERGFLGVYESQKSLPFQTPHPIYEYDILIYNSDFTNELRREFTKQQNLITEKGSWEALCNFNTPPLMRISFIGSYNGLPRLIHGGLQFIETAASEQNVSIFLEHDQSNATFAIPEMHHLVAAFRNDIARVGQFITCVDSYPYNHFSVLRSRNKEEVAAYGTSYGSTTVPRYIVLPQLKKNAHAVVEILQALEGICPPLFPDRLKNAWLQSEEFRLPDEKSKAEEIEAKVAETLTIVETLRRDQERLAAENNFIRQLLVATEDAKLEPQERLSGAVKKALDFLGFRVEDIDQKTKTAIKKEDFWVSDGDFFAITEVTGTANTNPKAKEFNDILGRIATIYKRKTDLIPPGLSNVSSLLVLNYHCQRHPSKRPQAYTGELEHLVESAVEQNIGVLSTVDLHRIIVAVKSNILTKEDARSILKVPGRILYGVDGGWGKQT
jgi:hypothetical protein